MKTSKRIAILGTGNLGRSLAIGWCAAGVVEPSGVTLTRRRTDRISDLQARGFQVTSDNARAVLEADVVVIAVQPQQLDALVGDIREDLRGAECTIVSVVSGVTIRQLRTMLGDGPPLVRAMPNTGIGIGESMTCLSGEEDVRLDEVRDLFDAVGRTLVIQEEMMTPATALCACGVAYFLRAIRAASQGGIEIGFHPDEALFLAAQTARGAASLLLREGAHPESEIDKVTTPRGCTIAGLNEMEHQGFSSALIKGIVMSAERAGGLYSEE